MLFPVANPIFKMVDIPGVISPSFYILRKTLSSVVNSTLYADLPFFPSPSLITGDSLRPDLVLVSSISAFTC